MGIDVHPHMGWEIFHIEYIHLDTGGAAGGNQCVQGCLSFFERIENSGAEFDASRLAICLRISPGWLWRASIGMANRALSK